jgi:hypothetical protein
MIETALIHYCGHVSKIETDHPIDFKKVLLMQSSICLLCQAGSWMEFTANLLSDLTGTEDPDRLETAELQRIMTIRDMQNRQNELKEEVIRRVQSGELNRSVGDIIITHSANEFSRSYTMLTSQVSADWWIEYGSGIADSTRNLTVDGFISTLFPKGVEE